MQFIYNVEIRIAHVRKFVTGLVAIPLLFALGYLGILTLRIARQSTHDEARKSDIIIVMGAAEYRGRPSPVYKARLDHAIHLYLLHFAPKIMTTGGAGGDPQFTEGTVGRSYLIDRGIPSENIVVEDEGATTVQSLAGAAEIMERMSLTTCIIVSDGYHIFRAKRVLQARGYTVFGSPREEAAKGRAVSYYRYFRQAVGYALWKIGVAV